jgi:uncharacterized protein (UPF0261 family)
MPLTPIYEYGNSLGWKHNVGTYTVNRIVQAIPQARVPKARFSTAILVSYSSPGFGPYSEIWLMTCISDMATLSVLTRTVAGDAEQATSPTICQECEMLVWTPLEHLAVKGQDRN